VETLAGAVELAAQGGEIVVNAHVGAGGEPGENRLDGGRDGLNVSGTPVEPAAQRLAELTQRGTARRTGPRE
jgi:hypothetical protein